MFFVLAASVLAASVLAASVIAAFAIAASAIADSILAPNAISTQQANHTRAKISIEASAADQWLDRRIIKINNMLEGRLQMAHPWLDLTPRNYVLFESQFRSQAQRLDNLTERILKQDVLVRALRDHLIEQQRLLHDVEVEQPATAGSTGPARDENGQLGGDAGSGGASAQSMLVSAPSSTANWETQKADLWQQLVWHRDDYISLHRQFCRLIREVRQQAEKLDEQRNR
jgi:hypothetical protein